MPAKAAPAAPTHASAGATPCPGKPLSAEEKAKTPCIFHQMPSGCVHGAKCACGHSKAAPPKPKSDGSTDPKPKPKTAPAAAAKILATVAIFAATMLQPFQAGQIEWAPDPSAGRHFDLLRNFEWPRLYDRSLMLFQISFTKAFVSEQVVARRIHPFPLVFKVGMAYLGKPITLSWTHAPWFGRLDLT